MNYNVFIFLIRVFRIVLLVLGFITMFGEVDFCTILLIVFAIFLSVFAESFFYDKAKPETETVTTAAITQIEYQEKYKYIGYRRYVTFFYVLDNTERSIELTDVDSVNQSDSGENYLEITDAKMKWRFLYKDEHIVDVYLNEDAYSDVMKTK